MSTLYRSDRSADAAVAVALHHPLHHLERLSDRKTPGGENGRTGVYTELTVSTGPPQGCCLSPKLLTLYPRDCASTRGNTIIKHADDVTILGFMEESGYSTLHGEQPPGLRRGERPHPQHKPKEIIPDFVKNPPPLQPLVKNVQYSNLCNIPT